MSISLIVMALLMFLLVPEYGAVATAWAFSAGACAYWIGVMVAAGKLFGVRFRQCWIPRRSDIAHLYTSLSQARLSR